LGQFGAKIAVFDPKNCHFPLFFVVFFIGTTWQGVLRPEHLWSRMYGTILGYFDEFCACLSSKRYFLSSKWLFFAIL
jgi:hypothetical protein